MLRDWVSKGVYGVIPPSTQGAIDVKVDSCRLLTPSWFCLLIEAVRSGARNLMADTKSHYETTIGTVSLSPSTSRPLIGVV
jgi:hypothetical protein